MISRPARLLLNLAFLTLVSMVALFFMVRSVNERRDYSSEMAAEKAITTIHTAETHYYSEHGRYATALSQLGPGGAKLIDKDLAGGEKGNSKFALRPTPAGYSIWVTPKVSGTSRNRVFVSDQNPGLGENDAPPYR